MDPQTLAALLSPDVYAELDTLSDLPGDSLARAQALRKRGFSPEVATALLTQHELRAEAEAKFGQFASDMLFTREGLAQATRLPVAAHHAGRMQQAGVIRIADLGCGIGADALAFAGLGIAVQAVEADEVTAAVATFNLRHLPHAEVTHARAEDTDVSNCDGLWFDPARRLPGRGNSKGATLRLHDPAQFSPPLDWVLEQAREVPAAGIKLGPGIDHELLPADAEAQWVSHQGDVVEVTCYLGDACARPGRNALVMTPGGSLQVHETDAPSTAEAGIGELGEYLLEPDGAIIRAGLVTALCAPASAHRIHPRIAYLSTDSLPVGPVARGVRTWRIREVLPASLGALRKELVARGIGAPVIKKRGADIVPEQVRRKLKLPPGDSATLVFTRVGEEETGGKHVVLLVDRIAD